MTYSEFASNLHQIPYPNNFNDCFILLGVQQCIKDVHSVHGVGDCFWGGGEASTEGARHSSGVLGHALPGKILTFSFFCHFTGKVFRARGAY